MSDSKKTPILMSAENPEGWKLEDILAQLRHEVEQKTLKIMGDKSEAAAEVVTMNHRIMSCLSEAALCQNYNYRMLAAKVGPNEGPLGKPRIGEGS